MDIKQLLSDAGARAKEMLYDAGITKRVEILHECNADEDPYLSIGDFMLTPLDAENVPTDDPAKVSRWGISVATYNPGVRYYPDGSGEPPSADVTDLENVPTLDKAIRKVIHWLIDQWLDQARDRQADAAMLVEDEAENDYREHQSCT